MIGKEDKLYHTESESNSRSSDWLNMSSSNYGGSQNNSVSFSLQERSVVKVQDVFNLAVGKFIGTTVETETPNFYAKITRKAESKPMRTLPIVNIAFDIEVNFKKITLEYRAILDGVGENQPYFSGKYE